MRRSSSVIEQSFSINLRIMKILCLYAPQKNDNLHKIRAYLIYFLFVIPISVLGILYLLLEDNLNMERVNYNAGFLAQITGCITRLLPFFRNGHKIRKCINYFESSAFAAGNEEQEKILDKCINVCRRNTLIFLVCVSGGFTSWVTKPFFWEGHTLPVDVWLPFNSQESLIAYVSVYLYLALAVLYNTLAIATIDPLIAGLAYHATCQIKILKDNLQHLNEYSLRDINYPTKASKSRFMYKRIQYSVNHHNQILKFVKEYEESFSLVVFSQFSVSVFVICFCCLQLSEVESVGFYFLQLLSYFSVILSQTYFYCFYGSTLFEESKTITNAVYMGEWYDYDELSKKALITLMERTKKPIIVTAGKILDLSLDTFTVSNTITNAVCMGHIYDYDPKSKKALMILVERAKRPISVTSGKILDLSLDTFTTILRRSYSLLAALKNYQ